MSTYGDSGIHRFLPPQAAWREKRVGVLEWNDLDHWILNSRNASNS